MIKNIFSIRWRLDHDRIIHAIKTAIACLLGFYIAKLANFSSEQWLLVTILVVMCAQISVGGLLQKSYMRLLGTIVGSIIALLTILFLGVSPTIVIVVVCLSAILFSYIATSPKPYSDAGTLGAVTVTIILIVKNPTLTSAAFRFAEITLGIVLAFLVSQFLLPMHARSYLRREVIRNFQRLYELYQMIYASPADNSIQDLEDAIRASLTNQRKYIKESNRELFRGQFKQVIYTKIMICERNIMRAMTFMNSTLELSGAGKAFLQSSKELSEFNQNISKAMVSVERLLDKNAYTSANQGFNLQLEWIDELKYSLKDTDQALTVDDVQQINIFLYCATVIAGSLNELEMLAREI